MNDLGKHPGHDDDKGGYRREAKGELPVYGEQKDQRHNKSNDGIHAHIGDPGQTVADHIQVVGHTGHQIAGTDTAEKHMVLVLDHIKHFPAHIIQHLLAVFLQKHDHHIPQR